MSDSPRSPTYAALGYFVRKVGVPERTSDFGPLPPGHPIIDQLCLGCDEVFAEGEFGCLIAIGPGGDLEYRRRAASGHYYNARAVPVHLRCAIGDQESELEAIANRLREQWRQVEDGADVG